MGIKFLSCAAAAVALSVAALVTGCAPAPGTDAGDARVDGSPMDGRGETGADVSVSCRTNAECDNGVFCDGEERCLGGECAAGPVACDDRHSCTQDSCDEAMRACTNAPDNSMCGDMRACNGIELCAPDAPGANDATGCTPVRPDNVVDCDDANNCTLDTCDDAAGCIHAPRDLDGDGHVDRACTVDGTPGGPAGDDCNDGDERVYPGAVELCEDNRDNNCNGAIDYAEVTCNPSNDTCASATVLPGPGTYWGATRGLRDDYALSCNPGSDADAVFEFTTTAVQDVTVATSSSDGQGAVAVVDGCSPLAEVRCGRGGFSSNPTVRLRSLPAGTHRIVVETGSGGDAFRLILRFDPPTVAPIEDACPVTGSMPAVELNDGMDHVARLATLEDDYVLSCNSFGDSSRDAVFRLTLAAPSDVTLSATPSMAFSSAFVSFRDSPCAASASERRCASSGFRTGAVNITQRALPAGTYWIIVESGDGADVTVRATVTSPPAPLPVEDRCPATEPNPAVELNDRLPHTATLSALEDDYMLSCNSFTSAGRDAVFRLTLAAPSDVTVTATPPGGGFANTAVSFRNSPCALGASERRCVSSRRGGGAVAVTQRALPAGTYWVVVENDDEATLTVQAAITTPPAPLPAEDRCPAIEPNPAVELNDGMPHTATLSALEDDYTLSCNSFGSDANDAVFRLTLAAPADVRVTATPAPGFTGTTYLSFRNAPCALSTSERRCLSAFGSGGPALVQRSVPAGTYWIIVENDDGANVTVQASITSPPAPTVTYDLSTPTTTTFIDACALPGHTTILPLRDDATAAVAASTIPFPLRVYGVAVAGSITISTNGFIALGDPGFAPLSGRVPEPSEPNLVLALDWQDLYTRSTGICYATTGTAPNRQFVVEWSDLHYCCSPDPAVHLTFEAIFNEAPAGTNNTIDVIYQRMDGSRGLGGAGIENDDGLVGTAIPGPATGPRFVRLTPR